MQSPFFKLYSVQPSMFQALLESCSRKQFETLDNGKGSQPSQFLPFPPISIGKSEQQLNAWFLMDDIPFDTFIEQTLTTKNNLTLEIKRVKSLREEQESKIAKFLRQDKYKSLKSIEIPIKDDLTTEKSTQSLSPRKTKKIDKGKPMRGILQ